ncbi:uncharacterized protein METZ01_LOCUS320647 [marine metagenome]|uniref:Uncharacterized protein n=1 Tax=marine metagenome TaxID=408172 RepID=A0A382P350_9ZZZZ
MKVIIPYWPDLGISTVAKISPVRLWRACSNGIPFSPTSVLPLKSSVV